MKKRIITVIATMMVAGLAAFAQPGGFGGGMPPMFNMGNSSEETLSPKERATQETDALKARLGLDDKQYKKIFTMLKNEYTAEANRSSMGGGFGGGMPMGGGMPPMGGGGFGGGMPMGGPMGGGSFNPSDMANTAFDATMQREAKKNEARAKKFAKILTPDQFKQWELYNEEILQQKAEEARKNAVEMQKQMEEFRKQFEGL